MNESGPDKKNVSLKEQTMEVKNEGKGKDQQTIPSLPIDLKRVLLNLNQRLHTNLPKMNSLSSSDFLHSLERDSIRSHRIIRSTPLISMIQLPSQITINIQKHSSSANSMLGPILDSELIGFSFCWWSSFWIWREMPQVFLMM